MGLLDVRELLQFPNGKNASDVLINGVHFNRDALNKFHYNLWSNGTLSNESHCFLVLPQFHPTFLDNGTFINGTPCYDAYYGIRKRGILGIVSACLFFFSIVLTLINLKEHGRLLLPQEKRFRAVGRRWQWYWLLWVAACGGISGIVGIDVDRDYLQSTPIILQSFFYYLMIPSILAAVWESIRHWGSWQERQIYDRDPFSIPQAGVRATKEFWMPLVFYFLAFMNFFMVIPRAWTPITKQHSLEQQDSHAKVSATDTRFKAGAVFATCAWILICYNLRHSLHYYRDRSWSVFHTVPSKFMIAIPLAGIVCGYSLATSFDWSISPLKYDVQAGWMYGLGNAPILLIILVLNAYGFRDENEDLVLLRMRRERGRDADRDLGLSTKKPNWWSKRHGELRLTDEERLKALTREVGGGRATQRNLERALELGVMPASRRLPGDDDEDGSPYRDESPGATASPAGSGARSNSSTAHGGFEHSPVRRGGSLATTNSSLTLGREQRVRSMLDV